MNPKILSPIIIFFIATTILYSQDSTIINVYPSAKEVDVSLNANLINNETIFIYEYNLKNSSSSQQSIWTFDVKPIGEVDSIMSPVDWRGFLFSNKFSVSWWAFDSTQFIIPGQSRNEFSFQSNELPSIKNFFVQGYIPLPVLESEPDSVVGGNFYENSKSGKTIGPNPVPEELNSLEFSDTLISYTNQSYELGWITNQSTADKYTTYFQNTKGFIQQNNSSEAINTLNTVLQNVQQDSGVTLTSEAYALLYFNTEYLIKRLKK